MKRFLLAAVASLVLSGSADAGMLLDAWKSQWLNSRGELAALFPVEDNQARAALYFVMLNDDAAGSLAAARTLKFWGLIPRGGKY